VHANGVGTGNYFKGIAQPFVTECWVREGNAVCPTPRSLSPHPKIT
jgi:hypothetical protein